MERGHLGEQFRKTGRRLRNFQRADLRRVFGVLPQGAVTLMSQDVFAVPETILQGNDLDAPSFAIVDERSHLFAGKGGGIRQRGMLIERESGLPLHNERVDPSFGNPIDKAFHGVERHHLGTEIEMEGPDREIPGPGSAGSDARQERQQGCGNSQKTVFHGSVFRF